MSISFLREFASRLLPLNISDPDQFDEAWVLQCAGLITAVVLRERPGALNVDTDEKFDDLGRLVWRLQVLALTPDGWRLVRKVPHEQQQACSRAHTHASE